MPLFLSQRDTTSRERMDDPDCDIKELQNTYRQFGTINSIISQWRRIYRQEIRPSLKTSTPKTLLDIGFGGGDIPIKLARWASDEGYELQVTAIDPDPRAINFVQELDHSPNIEFIQCKISDLDPSKEQFNFIISNHLLHHLSNHQLFDILSQSQELSSEAVIFNDIQRSDWAYLLFNIFSRPVFRSSFITADGLTSIKRSYTYEELAQIAPGNWQVESLFPFRLLLKYNHE